MTDFAFYLDLLAIVDKAVKGMNVVTWYSFKKVLVSSNRTYRVAEVSFTSGNQAQDVVPTKTVVFVRGRNRRFSELEINLYHPESFKTLRKAIQNHIGVKGDFRSGGD